MLDRIRIGPSHCATYMTFSTVRPWPQNLPAVRQVAHNFSFHRRCVCVRSSRVGTQECPYIYIHTHNIIYTMSMYESCALAHHNDVHLTMQCVARWVESETASSAERMQAAAKDTKGWLLLLSGALVFFMQVRHTRHQFFGRSSLGALPSHCFLLPQLVRCVSLSINI
jgi:hypothetical protein